MRLNAVQHFRITISEMASCRKSITGQPQDSVIGQLREELIGQLQERCQWESFIQ